MHPHRRYWTILAAQLYCFSQKPGGYGTGKRWRPFAEALPLLWATGPWRHELRQRLELLAARAPRHPFPGPCPFPCACTAMTAAPRSRPRLAFSQTTPPGSTARACSGTGQRTIHHDAQGTRVLLFVREHRRQDGRLSGPTNPFRDLGCWLRHAGLRVRSCPLRLPRGRTPHGDPLAAGAGDSGGVAARLLPGLKPVA